MKITSIIMITIPELHWYGSHSPFSAFSTPFPGKNKLINPPPLHPPQLLAYFQEQKQRENHRTIYFCVRRCIFFTLSYKNTEKRKEKGKCHEGKHTWGSHGVGVRAGGKGWGAGFLSSSITYVHLRCAVFFSCKNSQLAFSTHLQKKSQDI